MLTYFWFGIKHKIKWWLVVRRHDIVQSVYLRVHRRKCTSFLSHMLALALLARRSINTVGVSAVVGTRVFHVSVSVSIGGDPGGQQGQLTPTFRSGGQIRVLRPPLRSDG